MGSLWRRARAKGARPDDRWNAPQPAPRDTPLFGLLQARDGFLTFVVLADGKRLPVYDIAWGYDAGDEYAHITTNCSPGADGRPTDFFSTSEVTGLMDENERPIVLPSVG